MKSASLTIVGLMLLLLSCAGTGAQEESKTPAADKPAAKKKAAVDEAQESAALAFAREHHPELAELLSQLSTSNRREYVRAIRELSQTSTRLEAMKKTAGNRYPEALEAWKLDSRIKLLAAKSSMNDDAALETELKEAVKSRVDLRLRELTAERDRLTGRLKKIEQQIQEIESDPAQAADKDLQRVKASVTKEQPKEKKQQRKAKRAAKATKTKDAEKLKDGAESSK